jgi:hypothetical protein
MDTCWDAYESEQKLKPVTERLLQEKQRQVSYGLILLKKIIE